jgi:hypothetical protein
MITFFLRDRVAWASLQLLGLNSPVASVFQVAEITGTHPSAWLRSQFYNKTFTCKNITSWYDKIMSYFLLFSLL